MRLKKILWVGIALIVIALSTILVCNFLIETNAKGKVYEDTVKIPHRKVGVLLGTNKYLTSGTENPYFTYRVRAAVELFKHRKIDYILVSGDNKTKGYNEPEQFKEALIQAGIPADRIVLDYAGFRTLDSMVRAKKVFGQTSITVISQAFHNERAIYLAEKNGLKAIGYNAKDLSFKKGLKVQIREYLARTKVFVDLLFGISPKFLGEPISIGE